MNLTNHKMINYRSCINTKLELNNDITTLIGPNGSGKSNIMNGILLLKKIIFDRHDYYDKSNINASKCTITSEIDYENKKIKFKSDILFGVNERNFDDIITSMQKWNFNEFTGINKWIEIPINLFYMFDRNNIHPYELPARYHREFANFLRDNTIDKKSIKFVQTISKKIWSFFTSISYYSASQFSDPSKSPVSIEMDDEREIRRFRNVQDKDHSIFILNLFKSWKNKSPEYLKYENIISSRGIGLIDLIDFKEFNIPSNRYEVISGGKLTIKESKRKLIIPQFKIDDRILSPNQLSEGTFKTLALLYYVITDKSQLLLIEEPEVSIHHGLLNSVLEIIKNESNYKQIIITTHSDFVLDEMEPENIILIKKLQDKGTIATKVTKSLSKQDYLALKNYLNECGNLGEYWKEGGLEK